MPPSSMGQRRPVWFPIPNWTTQYTAQLLRTVTVSMLHKNELDITWKTTTDQASLPWFCFRPILMQWLWQHNTAQFLQYSPATFSFLLRTLTLALSMWWCTRLWMSAPMVNLVSASEMPAIFITSPISIFVCNIKSFPFMFAGSCACQP